MDKRKRTITVSLEGFEALQNALGWADAQCNRVDENGRCLLCDSPRGHSEGDPNEVFECENPDCMSHDFTKQYAWADSAIRENERRYRKRRRAIRKSSV